MNFRRKFLFSFSIFIIIGLSAHLFTKATLAAPFNNPVFATVKKVDQMISNALVTVNNLINNHESRLDQLEEKVNDLEDRIKKLEVTPTPSPTQPPNDCTESGFEMTFANWYVSTSGAVSATFDAHCYNSFDFYWSCSSSIHLQYSDDQATWISQLDLSKTQCEASGGQNFKVLGKYYRMLIDSTDSAQNFVFAQGRFSSTLSN